MIPDPISELIACNESFNISLGHEFESQWGAGVFILVAPFATKGIAIISNGYLLYTPNAYESGGDTFDINVTLPTTNASAVYTATVTIGSCLDCFGVLSGPDRPDICGVCAGDNTTCDGCDGIPNSGLEFDYCGECGGSNLTCLNVTAIPAQSITCTAQIVFLMYHEPAAIPVTWAITVQPILGTASINPTTGVVLWINPGILGVDWFIVEATSLLNSSVTDTTNVTFLIEDCSDCSGTQGGLQLVDLCGVCGGDASSCIDCSGIPNGIDLPDICGECGGDGLICLDCFGVPFGPSVFDNCGICGGDDTACNENSTPVFIIILVIMSSLFGSLLILFFLRWFTETRFIKVRRKVDKPSSLPPPAHPRKMRAMKDLPLTQSITNSGNEHIIANDTYGDPTLMVTSQIFNRRGYPMDP